MYDNSMYTYDHSTTTNLDPGAAIGVLLFALVITLAAYALHSLLLSQIFKKAGVEQWKAWVPFYNMWIMLELGGQKGFWAVLSIIPFVNIASIVFMYIAMYHIGLKLGKPGAFVLLAIFLPLVWLIWLAVDQSVWTGTKPQVKATTPSDSSTE